MVSISLNGRITLHAVLILPIKYDGTADRTSDSGVNGTLGAVNTEKYATSADFCFCCVSGHGLDSFNGANLCPIRRRRNRTKILTESAWNFVHRGNMTCHLILRGLEPMQISVRNPHAFCTLTRRGNGALVQVFRFWNVRTGAFMFSPYVYHTSS